MSLLSDLLKKTKGAFEKIPMLAQDAKEEVTDFFTPDENPDVRIGEFLREVPGATGDVAKEIAQGTARSFDFLGRKILGTELNENPSQMETNVENFLFGGRDKRAQNLSEVGEVELGIDAKKHPILAPFAGAGIIGLDAIPGMQGKSKGLKQLIKSFTDDVAGTLAKTQDKELIQKTLKESAPALTEKEIVKLTDEIAGASTKAKVFDVVNPTVRKTGAKKTPVARAVVEDVAEVADTTPILKETSKEITQQIDQELLQRSFIEESVESNPASQLIKFLGKGDDSLAEVQVRGENRGAKAGKLDDIVTELGYKDMDEAEAGIQQYQADKIRVKESQDVVRDLRLKLTETLDSEKSISEAKKAITEGIPETSRNTVSRGLDAVESETKKLSSRRLQDVKKYGISEDVMGRMLYAKAGGRLGNDEAVELAENLRGPIRDLLEKDAKSFRVDTPQMQAYAQELEGYFENVVKTLKAQSEAFPKDSMLSSQYKESARIHNKARATLEAILSEAGRLVQSSVTFGKYSRLPGMDGKIRTVRNQIAKFAEANPKHSELPTEFDMALDTVDLNDTTKMLDFLTQWNRSTFLQKLSEFQKASLLSAFSTHGVNALGNAIQQVLDIPVRLLAGTLDAGKSAVTGSQRTVFAGESVAQLRGAFKSAPSAFNRAVRALGNEHFAQELRRTEIEAGTVVPAIRGKFGKVVRLPFRLLQMADLGFRTVKQGAEGDALAHRIAKLEGLKGKAFTDRQTELRNNLPEDMLDLIDARVERSLMLEDLDGILKTVEDLKNKYPAMQFVIPFYRTLVNLTKEAYRMTPVGGVGRTVGRLTPGQPGRNIESAFHNKWTRDDSTKMEELSRQILGTSIMTWTVMGMLNGDIDITGPAPKSAGDRAVFYGQGKLPHAIRIGDEWVQFQRVQPMGQLLQIGSSIAEAIDAYKNTGELTDKDASEEAVNAIGEIASMVFTSSPFTGTSDLFALATGGAYNEGYLKAGNRYIGQLVGTFIPNILRRLTVAGDPIIYEKRDIKSQLKSRVPGLQKSLTPKRDVFGETVRKAGTFFSRFASPINTSFDTENKLYDEMESIKYTPSIPSRKAYGEDLSVKEYEMLQLYYGPRFRDEMWEAVNDKSYKTLNDEQKRDVLTGISRKVLALARQELFPVYLEKDQFKKQWEQDGYSPAVIEDALNAKFPYDKEALEEYAQGLLEGGIQQGEARQTIEELLK